MLTLNTTINGGSGGGQAYSAGAGIVISDGGISVASNALESVTQTISSGMVARGGDGSGGYFYLTQNGATMGVSGNYRISTGDNAAVVKTSGSTGLYLSGTAVQLVAGGTSRFNASGYNTYVYGGTLAGGIRVYGAVSSGYVKVKSNGGDYEDIITESHYATSDTPGIVQPDNSTCEVASGGIMSVKMPETIWTSGNAGSEITYSALDGANVIRAYKNGLLMESGADYVIGSSGVVSYATPLESSDKAAFEYYPPAPTRNIVPDGGKALKSAEPMEDILDEQGENTGEER